MGEGLKKTPERFSRPMSVWMQLAQNPELVSQYGTDSANQALLPAGLERASYAKACRRDSVVQPKGF